MISPSLVFFLCVAFSVLVVKRKKIKIMRKIPTDDSKSHQNFLGSTQSPTTRGEFYSLLVLLVLADLNFTDILAMLLCS